MKKGRFLIVVGLIGLMLGIVSVAAGQDELGCVSTWGYWLNHSKYQNVNGANRDPGWDAIGEDTQFLGNYQDPPSNTNILTWFEMLLIPPKKGNVYLILAHQYVAAYLNIHSGADPSILGTAMVDAEALLAYYNTGFRGTYPPAIPKRADHFTSNDRAWAEELASLLNQFNNGELGPGHCECPCWTKENLSGLTASSCVQSSDNEYISVATIQNYTLSTSDSEFPECNVVDYNKMIGFALAIKYAQFLDCRTGLEKLVDAAGLVCSEP